MPLLRCVEELCDWLRHGRSRREPQEDAVEPLLPPSGDARCRVASHDTPAIWTLEALEAMQVECFADDVPFKVEHLSRLSRDEVLRYFESGGQQPGQQPEDRVFDVAIVGGGVLGISVARDLAACQLSSIVVEKSTRIGGVWQINEYPGLRLHSPNGAAYRCLSLAPDWTKQHPASKLYRPTQAEILSYIESMADHPLIKVKLGTRYLEHRNCGGDGEAPIYEVRCGGGMKFRCRAVVLATGTNTMTSGLPHLPVSPSDVSDVAVFHSSDFTKMSATFHNARKRYLIGAGKAAVEILQGLNPHDENFVWGHRGHPNFALRGESAGLFQFLSRPQSKKWMDNSRRGAEQFAQQNFELMRHMAEGPNAWGINVGKPSVADPAWRAGVESTDNILHARRFLPCQVILDDLVVEGGVLTLICKDGPRIQVQPGDAVCFATGQRNNTVAQYLLEADKVMADRGVIPALPYSAVHPVAGAYTACLAHSYLNGLAGPYNDGFLRAVRETVEEHRSNPEQGGWPVAISFPSAVMVRLAPLILDRAKAHAFDYTECYHWYGKWFGKDLSPEDHFREMGV